MSDSFNKKLFKKEFKNLFNNQNIFFFLLKNKNILHAEAKSKIIEIYLYSLLINLVISIMFFFLLLGLNFFSSGLILFFSLLLLCCLVFLKPLYCLFIKDIGNCLLLTDYIKHSGIVIWLKNNEVIFYNILLNVSSNSNNEKQLKYIIDYWRFYGINAILLEKILLYILVGSNYDAISKSINTLNTDNINSYKESFLLDIKDYKKNNINLQKESFEKLKNYNNYSS